MSHFFPKLTLLTACLPLFVHAHDVAIYEGKEVRVIVPECPLAQGALEVKPISNIAHLSGWQRVHQVETYAYIQKIIKVWKEKGITDSVGERRSFQR